MKKFEFKVRVYRKVNDVCEVKKDLYVRIFLFLNF